MATEQFKIGDVVQLKSGGPEVTIDAARDGGVWCAYFLNGVVKRFSTSSDCVKTGANNIVNPERNKNLVVGETVQLKSGGPLMTIENVASASQVACAWFYENEILKSSFHGDSLKRAEESKRENAKATFGW